MQVKITAWNLLWGNSGQPRGELIAQRLRNTGSDIFILAEAMSPLLKGHVVDAGPDWGYGHENIKRKVQMISKNPWSSIARPTAPLAMQGRIVCATTSTPLGLMRIIGVCIPWTMAHVTSGRKDAKRWTEHLEFLQGLKNIIISERRCGLPIILAGDFNQCLPRKRARKDTFAALQEIISDGLTPSAGINIDGHVSGLLNHVVLWSDQLLSPRVEEKWSGYNGKYRLSDHAGLSISFSNISR